MHDDEPPPADFPRLIEVGPHTALVALGHGKALWFDWIGGGYVGRYGTICTLRRDERAGTFALASPGGEIVRLMAEREK